MTGVLKFDIKQNGGLSAVPYLCSATSGLIAGQTADFIRSRKILSTTATRRTYQVSAFLGAGVFSVATGFATCENRYMAVVFLSLAVMFTGLGRAGYLVNHVDFAPKYAGVLFGITNTAATVPGMVAPIVAGALTPNDTQEEWRNVFYVCAAFDLFGALVFGMFASVELEPWARDHDDDKTIDALIMSSIDVEKNPDMDKIKTDGDDSGAQAGVSKGMCEVNGISASLEQKGNEATTESNTLKGPEEGADTSPNQLIDNVDSLPNRQDLQDAFLKDKIDKNDFINQELTLTEIALCGARVTLESLLDEQ